MKNRINWMRIVVEGAVIVVSILLAFALDAYWDTLRERNEVNQRLAAFAEENELNRAALAATAARGPQKREAVRTLVESFGPNPPAMTVDSLAMLFNAVLGYSPATLEMSSMEILLSDTGDQRVPDDLYRLLVNFRADARVQDDIYLMFRDRRDAVNDRLSQIAPSAFIQGSLGLFDQTEFAVDVESILRDAQLQGRLAQLGIWSGNLTAFNAQMLARSDSLRAALETTRF